jgi:flagellum-specific peptidoglycan hydrolase FlgJ
MDWGKKDIGHSHRGITRNPGHEPKTIQKRMAYHRYLIFAMMSLTFLINSCGSAKRVKINASPTPAKSAENKTPVQKIKPSNSLRKLSVAEQVDRYVKTYAEVAQQEMKSYDIPASITLAQGILESGMGNSRLATQANNHFGIKCHKEWRGKRIYHDDDEKGECFRVYKDPRKSYRDHSLFLTTRSRYDFLFDYKKHDYKAWAKGLKKAGYATDPKYPDKLISLIERYRLDRYDLKKKKVKKETQSTPLIAYEKVHQVQKGDTLYSISKKYQVDLQLIVQENKIENNTIFLGQNLIIPQAQ